MSETKLRPVRALPQPPLFGRFEVLEVLGAGGFGRVLRCKDLESGEIVALKELHRFGADALLRFKKEFRVLADVQHHYDVATSPHYHRPAFAALSTMNRTASRQDGKA